MNDMKQIATSPKHRNINDIMKDPKQKAKLSNLIDEAVLCKTKIDFEKQTIKSLRDVAVDELGLKPALFNSYVNATFNNDYLDRKEGLEEQIDLLDAIINDAGLNDTPYISND